MASRPAPRRRKLLSSLGHFVSHKIPRAHATGLQPRPSGRGLSPPYADNHIAGNVLGPRYPVTRPIVLKPLINPTKTLDTSCYRGIRRCSLGPASMSVTDRHNPTHPTPDTNLSSVGSRSTPCLHEPRRPPTFKHFRNSTPSHVVHPKDASSDGPMRIIIGCGLPHHPQVAATSWDPVSAGA
jgi:hypothetical protein